ncbi:glycoside hydrolase [Brachyspira pilosicoli]|uniref:sialidase family protein n=1 Tax=Brachyspira pilosicoli TaxID=52584 RepID=UPI0025431379|nr:sialidase family protein [Brachyspira pilosicoli]WIH91224.1 glycoside hydrolase [Brachyspira pilosicoli]WIH93515.1 glycoside hydrolase [Brachyspira pilosicoli]
MSKKIIYLLSLLMALSLVFASCKKNGAGDITGDLTTPPTDNETGKDDADKNTGLFDSWEKIPTDTAIKEYEIFRNNGTDYYRNPVIVSLGDGRVFLFAELRYKRPGAANDVGVDGEGAVDIIYKVSKNSGYDWDSQTYYVVKNSSAIADAHGAPNIFLLENNTKIVVVATAGGGIGRTSKKVGEDGKAASRVDYAVGTINDTKITWDTGWQEVQLNDKKIIDEIQKVQAGGRNSEVFNQYSTAQGKGLVLSDNKSMLLSLVVANQGATTSGNIRELMGRYLLKGTLAGTTITWTEVQAPIAYTTSPMDLGPWKETQLYGGTESDPKFFVVPSPWTGTPNLKLGKATGKTEKPTATMIAASEGTAGYIELKWFGTGNYDINTYKDQQKDRAILLHVADTSRNLTMHVVDNSSDQFTEKGNGWLINSVGKSSSIEVLPDGTIMYAAEQGGSAGNYKFFFYRYSQHFIATKTGAN